MRLLRRLVSIIHALMATLFIGAALVLIAIAAWLGFAALPGDFDRGFAQQTMEAMGILAAAVVALQTARTSGLSVGTPIAKCRARTGDATMPDEKQAAADEPHSTTEVDIDDKPSLAAWAEALGVTGEALESAVKAVGPRVDRIKDFLTGGMAGDQEDA